MFDTVNPNPWVQTRPPQNDQDEFKWHTSKSRAVTQTSQPQRKSLTALSRCYSTRTLWVALFPASPVSSLFKQPWYNMFPHCSNIDAKLNADTSSTWNHAQQWSQPQTILNFQPPSCLDYRARHGPQLIEKEIIFDTILTNLPLFKFHIQENTISIGSFKSWHVCIR